jgi:hypothetical protein
MSAGDQAVCAYKECGRVFIKATHNQKYHEEECCRLATNARIMEKYYERKERRGGAKRICKTPGCQTKLSRYNASKYCATCEAEADNKAKEELLGMIT